MLCLSGVVSAGLVKNLPNSIIFEANTGNQAEFISIEYYYRSNGHHFAVISYYPVDTNGNRRDLEQVYLRDVPDNPATSPANCTAAGEPYECCTGEYPGDQNNGCIETKTDFTNFVQGYAATLSTRSDQAVWADIQNKYELAP